LPAVDRLTAMQLARATELRDGEQDLPASAMADQDAGFCHS
jgi:hypothetical protein